MYSTPVTELVRWWFHHLRHVDIPFRPWEYSGHFAKTSFDELVDDFMIYAGIVSVKVDKKRVLEQQYLNHLHQIYEKNYDGNQSWTDYHEHLHAVESKLHDQFPEHKLEINYRQLSGPLNRPFRMEWLMHGQTNIKSGDVYLAWDELGKKPYTYWHDHEPDDIQRICELAKPWITIRPKIHVCLRDTDLDPGIDLQFQEWWANFEKEWCQHYTIPRWSSRDSNSVLVIGKIQNYQNLESLLDQKIWPKRITL